MTRNLKLIDAVIQLLDIANLIETELGDNELSQSIRYDADRLHLYSIQDDKANSITKEIIKQAKK